MNEHELPYSYLDTPAVLLDMDKLERNILEMTRTATDAGIELRPHVKVHQCPSIARMQIDAGACGVEVGNVDQAAVMADAGINDIMIAHPLYGEHKAEKLRRLVNNSSLVLSIVVDMIEQAEIISSVAQEASTRVPVHIKVETGGDRYGVLPGNPVLSLARKLQELPGIDLRGVYTHEVGALPSEKGVAEVAIKVGSIMAETARMLRREGFHIQTVAVGASPTFRATCQGLKEGLLTEITEVHPGGCVIGDIIYVKSFGSKREACALTVLTSVMSASHLDNVVIDAGSKSLGGDSLITRREEPGFFWNEMPSFGSIQGRPDLWLGRVGAESGLMYYMDSDTSSRNPLSIGDRIEVVPINATLVMNIHETVYGVRNGKIEREFKITGRGLGS